MDDRLHYGTSAKVLHWLVVALLAVQLPIGWFMPEVHAGQPGRAITLHISLGLTILALILLRLCLAYFPSCGGGEFSTAVAACFLGSRPWAAVCTASGCNHHWLAVHIVPGLLGLLFQSRSIADAGGKKHGCDLSDRWLASIVEWSLLMAIGIHVAAAVAHIFIYRDRIMQRMLPGRR